MPALLPEDRAAGLAGPCPGLIIIVTDAVYLPRAFSLGCFGEELLQGGRRRSGHMGSLRMRTCNIHEQHLPGLRYCADLLPRV